MGAHMLARMAPDGVIRRKPDPADGRSSLTSRTARTMKLIAPARAIMARGNREALAGFNDSEVEQLVALLQRVIANVCKGSDCSPESRVGTKPIPSKSGGRCPIDDCYSSQSKKFSFGTPAGKVAFAQLAVSRKGRRVCDSS